MRLTLKIQRWFGAEVLIRRRSSVIQEKQSRVAAPPSREEPSEVDAALERCFSHVQPGGALKQRQDILERLYLQVCQETSWCLPGRAGGGLFWLIMHFNLSSYENHEQLSKHHIYDYLFYHTPKY